MSPGAIVERRESADVGQAPILTYTVIAKDEQDPTPELVCNPPSGSHFPRGTTVVTCTATDAAGNSTVCQFLVTVGSHFPGIVTFR